MSEKDLCLTVILWGWRYELTLLTATKIRPYEYTMTTKGSSRQKMKRHSTYEMLAGERRCHWTEHMVPGPSGP